MSIMKKVAVFLTTALMAGTFICQTVCAESNTKPKDNVIPKGSQVRISPEGNWIREGGHNRYDGTQAVQKTDAILMEKRLRTDGYILLSELTDEQYEAFITNEETDWWFERCIRDDKYKEFYSEEYFHIYIFEPSFMDWWADYQKYNSARSVNRIYQMEINNSSVVIDYRYWWSLERVGKDLSNEINDGIPSWYDTGYVKIESPIDVEIKFQLQNDQTFYTLYVTADTPLRCKMKYGNYRIEEINDVQLGTERDDIPLNNNIQVGWGDNLNEETPVELDITKTVEVYNIPNKDITGRPDRSLDQNQDEKLTKEDTLVQKNKEKKRRNIFRIIIICLLALTIIGMIGVYIYFRKKRG